MSENGPIHGFCLPVVKLEQRYRKPNEVRGIVAGLFVRRAGSDCYTHIGPFFSEDGYLDYFDPLDELDQFDMMLEGIEKRYVETQRTQ